MIWRGEGPWADYVSIYNCDCGHEWREEHRWGPTTGHTDYFGCPKCGNKKFSYRSESLNPKESKQSDPP
jgi:DNA-directed RNA polymerase subunit M/transcription elongation factor TFIIS